MKKLFALLALLTPAFLAYGQGIGSITLVKATWQASAGTAGDATQMICTVDVPAYSAAVPSALTVTCTNQGAALYQQVLTLPKAPVDSISTTITTGANNISWQIVRGGAPAHDSWLITANGIKQAGTF